MERSLSVLLPVRDAEMTLSRSVHELLDVLPELTRSFEIVIIDDGSRDATIELADELACRYPQVRVVRHGRPLGRAAAVRSGVRGSRGEILLLGDEGCRLALDELGRMWRAMDDHELVLGRPAGIPEPKWNRWRRPGDEPGTPGFQMVYRRAVEPIEEALADQATLRDRLLGLGYQWHEVTMHTRPARIDRTANDRRTSPLSGPSDNPLRGPNYLARLRELALGE